MMCKTNTLLFVAHIDPEMATVFHHDVRIPPTCFRREASAWFLQAPSRDMPKERWHSKRRKDRVPKERTTDPVVVGDQRVMESSGVSKAKSQELNTWQAANTSRYASTNSCVSCGPVGHWRGDPDCPMVGQGTLESAPLQRNNTSS